MPELAAAAPGAVYVIVSNPVDILTYSAVKSSGIDPHRIIGSGTMLDSSRLRTCLASYIDVSAQNVHGYVLGEHGDTSVIPWSLVSVAGMPLKDFCSAGGICGENKRSEIEKRGADSRSKSNIPQGSDLLCDSNGSQAALRKHYP